MAPGQETVRGWDVNSAPSPESELTERGGLEFFAGLGEGTQARPLCLLSDVDSGPRGVQSHHLGLKQMLSCSLYMMAALSPLVGWRVRLWPSSPLV